MISIIIPCFNEEKNLEKLLKILYLLKKKYSKIKIEILIVDNGSTDNSLEIIKKNILFKKKKILLVEIKKNIGYGNGIYRGILTSRGDFIAWLHADLQTNPFDVIKIFLKYKRKLLLKNCAVKGKRINRSLIDVFFTFGMSILVILFFKVKINDINGQPKIFYKSFIKKIKNPPKDFSFDLYCLLLARKLNFNIIEHPVVWNNRFAGEAKGGGSIYLKIKLTFRTLSFMFRLLRNSKWN